MDSEVDEGLGPRPGTERTGDSTEATKPSPDSSEPSTGRRGSKRRVRAAVSAPGSGDSQPGVRVLRAPGSGDPQPGVRVLRARGAEASRTNVNESKRKTTVVHRGRGRPAGPRPNKNTPATQPQIKKSTAKKASRHTPGPKLSKSRKGKGRPPTQVSRIPPATACKPEAEMEASVCGDEETGSFKGSDDSVADPDAALDKDPSFGEDLSDLIYNPEAKTEKSRRRRTVKQKEVKKEESENEEEEEEDDIKKEETTEVVVQSEAGVGNNTEPPRKRGRQQKDDKVPRPPKQRKKPPVQYVRCEIEGCGTVLAHPRYLQHHIKYQHLLKKKYVCDHPSCGRLFRLQKQLLRHAKHHTDQRDYICEFCARAFKSSHNLAVHRMIHTGEKPIQCEICGFTCRQKASLNWHMKKHDAGASYQFSCSICSKKFEKKDSVVAHKAKSHPEVLIAEALAANGGSVISSPITIPIPEAVPVLTPTPETVPVLPPTPETVPVLARSDRPPVSQGNHDVVTSTLTPLQQVVLPLAPQTPLDGSQGQFLHLPAQHVVQVAPQQQVPALLHLTTAPPAHLSSISHPQLIHLSTVPTSTVADPQSTLLTLSSVSTLASTASLASQQALQWGRGTHEDTQLPGEGELWDRVVVGGGHQDVEEMMWEENEERRKEDGGVVWERERGRQIILQCAEVQEDGLI